MSDDKWVLWENEEMSLQAAFNPGIPRTEGFHLVLLQKKGVPAPWFDPVLYGRMSLIAARASAVIIKELGMADWINIHCDGNIGAAKGNPNMHIHIFGRNSDSLNWGKPLQLPSGEGPYGNDPLTYQEIEHLRSAFAGRL